MISRTPFSRTLFIPMMLNLGIYCGAFVDDNVPVLPKDNLPPDIRIDRIPAGFEALPVAPENNPTTMEKAKLGRRLFFDPILSTDGTTSCASCHQPEHGFASPDGLAIGIKGQKGRRNAPTVLNRGYGTSFSWDGRDDSLEAQSLGPLTSETELGGDVETVLGKLRSDPLYVQEFADVFGKSRTEDAESSITQENLTFALACFERTLVSGDSAVDRFRASDYESLSKSARQGMWIFESRGGCWKCHSGASFADEEFHNTGVGFGQPTRDEGRFEFTKDPQDKFKFKTPTLRDVELTAPYMHDGSLTTLREVVEFYNKGGSPEDPDLDKDMKPLQLTEQEIGFLVDFLKALTGDGVPLEIRN